MATIKSKSASLENSLKVADVKMMKPEQGEVILIRVDNAKMTNDEFSAYNQKLLQVFAYIWPDNHVVILPTTISIT